MTIYDVEEDTGLTQCQAIERVDSTLYSEKCVFNQAYILF